MNSKLAGVLVVICITFHLSQAISKTLSDNALRYVKGYGQRWMFNVALATDNQTYQEAVAAFITANDTCNDLREQARSTCGDCVFNTCLAVSDACPSASGSRPDFFEALGHVIEQEVFDPVEGFFVNEVGGAFDDFGDWVTGDFANFFADDVAGAFSDAFDATEDFFTGDFVDAFKDVGGAFESVGNDVANFFEDDVANFFKDDVVDAFKDVGNFFEEDVGGFFTEDIPDFFGNLFGGKRRRKRSATAPPTCDDFKRPEGIDDDQYNQQLATACSYYASPDECESCDLSAETVCPELLTALDAVLLAKDNYLRWENNGYDVTSVSYDTENYDPVSDGFTNVVAEVTLFGAPQTITMTDAHVLNTVAGIEAFGVAVAQKALANA